MKLGKINLSKLGDVGLVIMVLVWIFLSLIYLYEVRTSPARSVSGQARELLVKIFNDPTIADEIYSLTMKGGVAWAFAALILFWALTGEEE